MRRPLLLGLLLALTSCHCGPRRSELSPEASAIFARASQPGAGGSLVVDLERLRREGLLRPDALSGGLVGDTLMQLLPGLAVELQDQESGPALARLTVMAGLLRSWEGMPTVRRLALLMPWRSPPTGGPSMEALGGMLEGTTLVMAVEGGRDETTRLIAGLAALDRAGGEPLLEPQGADLCLPAKGELPSLCLRAGDGYLALSTPSGLQALVPAVPPTPAPEPEGTVARLRVEMPLVAEADITVTLTESLKLVASVRTSDEPQAQKLEQAVQAYLQRMDGSRAEARAVLLPALDRMKSALASDNAAPGSLRTAAAAMEVEKLLDPSGNYRQLRESVSVLRRQERVSIEASVPAPLLRRLREGTGGLAELLATGVMASGLSNELTRVRCQERRDEVEPLMRQYISEQREYRERNGRWAATFDELEAFRPGAPATYSYCMPGSCLECTRPGCPHPSPEENPCLRLLREEDRANLDPDSPPVCAFGTPGQRDETDIWMLGPLGDPQNVENGCP